VNSLTYQARDDALVIGTYGRGIYILDDAAPLRALTPENLKRDALLVSTTRGRQWQVFSALPVYGAGGYYAPNPEFDPTITYYVRDAASGGATITIRDARGATVRTLTLLPLRGSIASRGTCACNPRSPPERCRADEAVAEVAARVRLPGHSLRRESTTSPSAFLESRASFADRSPSKSGSDGADLFDRQTRATGRDDARLHASTVARHGEDQWRRR
jgi:hypothetical protein